MQLSTLDIIVFIIYVIIVIGLGNWVSRGKKGKKKTSQDYFLAGNTLPWWAIGASLIASNISAEQFIGMSGSGYALGLAIASYEWMAALTLLVVAKFLLPIFLEKRIYTMPQFLEIRYDARVRTSLAVFWLLLYIFVNLTSVLYLGALSLETIIGVDLQTAIIGLALFSLFYSLYGGLTAVAWTDVIQVFFLILGGFITSYLALNAIGGDGGFFAGLQILFEKTPERFSMIFSQGQMMIPDGAGGTKDAYMDLPGISVIVGGMWIANLNYWGCNQYITQRALAAKSLAEAQKGLVFAGYLKLIIPLIVVVPGIATYVIMNDPAYSDIVAQSTGAIGKSDEAYPWLLNTFVFSGAKGLAFAALIAAVVSSLSSMANSTATIFTMDLYKHYINKEASETNLVRTGRIVSVVSVAIAVVIAPALKTLDQAFQFIQEFTGFISPAVVAIFLMGMFWKKTSANAALWAAILAFPLSLLFKFYFAFIPFLNRMGYVFLILCVIMVVISWIENKGKDNAKYIDINPNLFYTGNVFNITSIVLCAALAILYIIFWNHIP